MDFANFTIFLHFLYKHINKSCITHTQWEIYNINNLNLNLNINNKTYISKHMHIYYTYTNIQSIYMYVSIIITGYT